MARVGPFLSPSSTELLMCTFISSGVHYSNALLSELPKKSNSSLQLRWNSAEGVLMRTRGREHIAPVLQSHWLPKRFRVDFKVLPFLYNCLTCRPTYLPYTYPISPRRLKHTRRQHLVTKCGTACWRRSDC